MILKKDKVSKKKIMKLIEQIQHDLKYGKEEKEDSYEDDFDGEEAMTFEEKKAAFKRQFQVDSFSERNPLNKSS